MNDSLLGDKTLVDKACSGDESAFADLINWHRSLVFGIIWAVLQNADDTEDATQETFILAYRNLNQLDDVGKFSSWLCTIARNVALKWVRKRTLEARGLSRVQEYLQLEFVHPEKAVGATVRICSEAGFQIAFSSGSYGYYAVLSGRVTSESDCQYPRYSGGYCQESVTQIAEATKKEAFSYEK